MKEDRGKVYWREMGKWENGGWGGKGQRKDVMERDGEGGEWEGGGGSGWGEETEEGRGKV